MTHYINDYELDAEQLEVKYEKRGEHPGYPINDWRGDVANCHTTLSYWQWVKGLLTLEEDELERDSPYHVDPMEEHVAPSRINVYFPWWWRRRQP